MLKRTSRYRRLSLLFMTVTMLTASYMPSIVYAAGVINIPESNNDNWFKQLNDIFFYEKNDVCASSLGAPVGAAATANDQNGVTAYNYYVSKGLSPIQALAIIGNYMQETGGGTLAIDPGNGYTNITPSSGSSVGIAQWLGGRKTGPNGLEAFAASQGKPPSDLQVQLDFSWKELNGGYKSSVLTPMLATNDLSNATDIFLRYYESPGHYDIELPRRLGYARSAAAALGVDLAAAATTAPSTLALGNTTDTSGGVTGNCSSANFGGTVNPVSGNTQELAKQILACTNITLRDSAWKSSGVSPKQQIINLSEGKSSVPGYQYSSDPTILRVLATLCQQFRISQGSLIRTEQTSGGTSVHPLGLAADIGAINGQTLDTLTPDYIAFLKAAEAVFKSDNRGCSMGVWPSLVTSIQAQVSYCRVFADAGTGPHLHIALPRSALLSN